MSAIGQGTIIRDVKTNRRYHLGEQFKAGHFSLIYKLSPLGPPHGHDGMEWVAKISRGPDVHDEFDKEYENIEKIRKVSGGRFVPDVHWGVIEDATSSEKAPKILIMEFMRREWFLARQISDMMTRVRDSGPDAQELNYERRAVAAALQYLELLYLLHNELHMTCQDRKVGDLYWKSLSLAWDHSGELYVLDWNVVHEDTPDNRVKDYRTFGRLWYELLVGHSPETLSLRDIDHPPSSEPRWRMLSRGMRRLLFRSWRYGEWDGFTSLEEMKAAWQAYGEWLIASPEDLARKGWDLIRAHQTSPSEKSSAPMNPHESEVN